MANPPPKREEGPISVRKAVDGKNVFITGATGFLGKVLVEKMLRSTDVGALYLLIRPRKGSTAEARMKAELIESPIFERLKQEIGVENFLNMTKKKLVCLAGDVTLLQGGLSQKDHDFLCSTVHHIVHCAAIVDFNERLDRAVELNIHGALRMMEIAQRCPLLQSFIHISTCYVNSNRRGVISEKIYPLGFDPEVVLKKIQGLSQSELQKDALTTTGLLREWPNTYTFTKAIAEPMMVAKRGTVPLCIIRPSIIGASWREPCPGWVDVVSAAGAVYISAGLGLIHFLPGTGTSIADIVPVDYVVNVMLAAIPTIQGQNTHMVLQAASSLERPLRWDVPIQVLAAWFQGHTPENAISPVKFRFIASPQEYQLQFFLRYSVPSSVLGYVSQLGTQKQKEQAKQFSKLVWKVRVLTESFQHFVENEWIFENPEVQKMFQRLVEEDRALFPMELTTLDWSQYTINFGYGLSKYILKADIIPPAEAPNCTRYKFLKLPGAADPEFLLEDNMYSKLFPNVAWAQKKWSDLEKMQFPEPKQLKEMYSIVMKSEGVQKAIKEEVEQKLHDSRTREQAEARARRIVEKMFGDKDAGVLKGMGVTLRKIWKQIYETIKVDVRYCEQIREIAKKGPVIFIPTHRSYIDFLVVSYVTFACQLPIPFIAAGEDFLGILLVRSFFRRSGAFFLRRSFLGSSDDQLYSAIFKEYVTQLMLDGQCLEFFIEGTRSRSGKMLQPKLGLLSIVTNVFFEKRVPDLTIVPISINYEKTMEGDLYSNELMGDSKIRESLRSLLRSLGSVLSMNFGEISVVLNEPISLKQFTENMTLKMRTNPTPIPPVFSPLTPVESKTSSSPNATTEKKTGEQKKADDAKKNTKSTKAPEKRVNTSPSPSAPSPSSAPFVEFDPFKNKADARAVNRLLSYKVVHALNVSSQCMPTHVMATLLLMYRHGITKQQLVEKMDWLQREILLRGGCVELFEREYRSRLADGAMVHLRRLIAEPRRGFYEPAIALRSDYPNMLALGHYRNKIVHLFFREGLWACALYSFGETTDIKEHGVHRDLLQKEVSFLHELLQLEFIWKENPDEPEDFELALTQLVQRGILKITAENMVEVAPTGERMFSVLCALFWPFIDSYYVCAMTLASLQPDRQMDQQILLQRIQWLATTLYHESLLCFYESCSLETLSNALQTLARWKVIAITKAAPVASSPFAALPKKQAPDKYTISLLPPFHQDEALQDLVSRIGKLRKQPLRERKNMLRRNLIADIPILAKL